MEHHYIIEYFMGDAPFFNKLFISNKLKGEILK